jgi:hypothetical protein
MHFTSKKVNNDAGRCLTGNRRKNEIVRSQYEVIPDDGWKGESQAARVQLRP